MSLIIDSFVWSKTINTPYTAHAMLLFEATFVSAMLSKWYEM